MNIYEIYAIKHLYERTHSEFLHECLHHQTDEVA